MVVDSHQRGSRSSTEHASVPFLPSLSGAPIALVVSITLTLVIAVAPATSLLSAIVPLLLMTTTKNHRPLLAACLIGNLLMIFGSVGEVEFLGYLTIAPSTPAFAVAFSNTMAIAIYAVSKRSAPSWPYDSVRLTPSKVHVALLCSAIAFLLIRFTAGIPILQGDASRLSGLLTVNPYLGLLSGIVPIAASFLSSKKSTLVFALKILVVVLVLGTASRLLLGAVLIGLVTSSTFLQGKRSGKSRFYLVGAGLVTLVSMTKVYAARTAEGIQQVYESRIQNLGGITGWVSDIVGPSVFYAARNGLVVHEILMDNDIRPPAGFISGSLLHSLNLGANPELWLTSAIGFDVISVGAIATPIWSGAQADFGNLGSILIAAVMGTMLATILRRVPNLQYWFAFGILLSFYGSYLVSSQFMAATILIAGVVMWSNSKAPRGDAPSPGFVSDRI